jgi:pSer/pThr/pTyr-binding forkhead associated (FHA) protein
MTKMTISLEGVDLKDIELTKERTTLGRRPYNDIVIDNLAVSGEHAVFVLRDGQVSIEDLNSTNGTYVNGKAVREAQVGPQDLIEIARYKLRLEPSAPVVSPSLPLVTQPMPLDAMPAAPACLRILNGPANGREVPLVKVVTTMGKPGLAVASITQRTHGYVIAWVDGHDIPTVNGQPVGQEPMALHHQDVIVLAGTKMQFLAD